MRQMVEAVTEIDFIWLSVLTYGKARIYYVVRVSRPSATRKDIWDFADFFAAEFDAGVRDDGAGDFGGEDVAIDGEGVAAGDAGGVGAAENEGAEAAEFLLEEPGGGGFLLGFEGIAADQFGEAIGLVGGGGVDGAHFVEHGRVAGFGDLPGGFGAGEAATEDVDGGGHVVTSVLYRGGWGVMGDGRWCFLTERSHFSISCLFLVGVWRIFVHFVHAVHEKKVGEPSCGRLLA